MRSRSLLAGLAVLVFVGGMTLAVGALPADADTTTANPNPFGLTANCPADATPIYPVSASPLPDGGTRYSYAFGGYTDEPPAGFDALTATDAQLKDYGALPRPTSPDYVPGSYTEAQWEQYAAKFTPAPLVYCAMNDVTGGPASALSRVPAALSLTVVRPSKVNKGEPVAHRSYRLTIKITSTKGGFPTLTAIDWGDGSSWRVKGDSTACTKITSKPTGAAHVTTRLTKVHSYTKPGKHVITLKAVALCTAKSYKLTEKLRVTVNK